ncbi:MAG TPA: hypothetical protein VEX39_15525 [Thermoleophilaceae bacterium]|nr:hypothetical protein [Thermoleophilaceae bacterium]
MRLRFALLGVLLALLIPASAHAAGLFVLSGSDAGDPTHSIPGLISLADGGGEFQNSASGGAVIAGSGVGPYVYNSGGTGSIRQFSGGTYRTITSSIPAVKSMTVTGRGLVVAIGNKLQYVGATGARSDVPYGTLGGGDSWVAIATAPNGHVIGWSWKNGWGQLWDFNLAGGAPSSQDYTGTINDPFFNNRDNGGTYGAGPVGNAGDIAVDGTGGLWVANALKDGTIGQIWHSPAGGSLNLLASNYYKPHITATGDGKAYASTSDYSAPGFITDVYRFPGETKVTSAAGKLTKSAIFDLAVDRCYTTCSVSLPGAGGGGGGGESTGKTASPLKSTPKSAKVTKAGLVFKLACRTDCTVSVSGKLVYAKAKRKRKTKKASAAASTKLRTTKVKLKAGKAKTVVIKLSKGQRKAIKKAKRKKRKVTANLKVKVKPKGGRTSTRSLKLKVR